MRSASSRQQAKRPRSNQEVGKARANRSRGCLVVPDRAGVIAISASTHGPDYGSLWGFLRRLNTTGKDWPGSPTSAFKAIGNGGNIIFIDPAHDLLVVWRERSIKRGLQAGC